MCLSIFSYFIGKINPPQIKLDYDFVVKVNIKQGKFNKAHMTHEFPMNREVYLERSICETTQQSYLYLSGFRYMKSKEHYFALIMFSRQFSLQPYMCTKTSINVKFKLTWELFSSFDYYSFSQMLKHKSQSSKPNDQLSKHIY